MMLLTSKFIRDLRNILLSEIQDWEISSGTVGEGNREFNIIHNSKSNTTIAYRQDSLYGRMCYLYQDGKKVILSDLQSNYLVDVYKEAMQVKVMNNLTNNSPLVQENIALKKQLESIKKKFVFISKDEA